MRIWADVTNAAGTLQGEGPITNIQQVIVTRELDGVGSVALTLPASDQRVQDLIDNERRLKVYTYQNDAARLLGVGIVRAVQGDNESLMLDLDGPDQLDELKRPNTLLARIYNGVDLDTTISGLIALASGWTATTSDLPTNDVYARFDGASVLKALQEVCARYGLHFRWDADKTIKIGVLGDSAGVRVLQAGSRMMREAYDNTDVIWIDRLVWKDTTEALANWIVPVGAGQGGAAITLAYSTRGSDRYQTEAEYPIEFYGDGAFALQRTTGGTYSKLAQSFTGTGIAIGRVRLPLRKYGSPTGTLTLRVETNNGSVGAASEPSGTLAHANATTTVNEADLPETEYIDWVEFDFDPFYLNSGTHWLVLSTDRAASGTNYVTWAHDGGNTPEYGGTHRLKYYDGAWNDGGDYDFLFDVQRFIESRQDAVIAEYPVANWDTLVGIQQIGASTVEQLAQSFVGDGGMVAHINLWMQKRGTVASYMYIEIQGDSGGSPDGTAISTATTNGTSASVQNSSIGSELEKVKFNFDTTLNNYHPPTLADGTTYWIVLKSAATASATNFVQWAADKTSPGFTDGEMQQYASAAWSIVGADAIFEVVAVCEVHPYAIQNTTGPDGSTLYYLADSDSITAYGQIERILKVNISPLEHTAEGLEAAANALYDAAAAWLQRFSVKQSTYHFTAQGVTSTLKPGQKIPVNYTGEVENLAGEIVGWRSLNAEFWITKVRERFGTGGASYTVEISDIDLPETDVASDIMGKLEKIELRDVEVRPGPATFTYVYTDLISGDKSYTLSAGSGGGTVASGKDAVFTVPVPDSVMDVLKCTVRIRTFPPRVPALADTDGYLWYGAEAGSNYPAGLSIYIDQSDRSAALGGPWLTASDDNAQFDETFDITAYLRDGSGRPAFGDHLLEVKSAGRTISGSEDLAVGGYRSKTVTTPSPAPGLVECTITMQVITQPIDTDSAAGSASSGVTPNPIVGGFVIGDLSDVDTSTTAPVALDGLLFDGSNWVPGVTGIAPAPGRLSLSSTERYPTSDITAATTLWYLRTGGRYIHLYENDTTSAMIRYELPFQTSISLAGKTANTNYDVFIYDNSGTLTLELVAWTNDTTRATTLTYRYGVKVKSGELNKLYLGTIRTTGTTGQCEDSEAKRFVWNEYQTKRRNLHADDISAHTYASATIRQWQASSAAKVEWVNGDRTVFVSQGEFSGFSSVSTNRMVVGLGLDTTTAHSRFVSTRETAGYVRFHIGLISAVDEGYHYLAATQSTNGSTATYGSYDIDVELDM